MHGVFSSGSTLFINSPFWKSSHIYGDISPDRSRGANLAILSRKSSQKTPIRDIFDILVGKVNQ